MKRSKSDMRRCMLMRRLSRLTAEGKSSSPMLRQEWADRRRKVEEDKINEGYLAEHTKLLEEYKATECAEAMRLKGIEQGSYVERVKSLIRADARRSARDSRVLAPQHSVVS